MERETRFYADEISGDVVNLVGGNQYHNYVQQVIQQRDSFARMVAATKTKARLLFWSGFLMVAGGGTAFMLPILKALKDSSFGSPQNPFDAGLHIGGYPVGIIGVAVGFVGQFILVTGIILHIVAASRRKTLMNLPPLPPLWHIPDERH